MRGASLIHAVARDVPPAKKPNKHCFTNRKPAANPDRKRRAVIYVFDADGRLKLCKPQFETQAAAKAITEFHAAKHFAMAIASEHAANDQQVMLSGAQREFEEHMVLDGRSRVFLSIKRPLLENGVVTGVVGISTDITERKAAEEALRLYANIFEQTNEAILVTDRDNCIVRVNPALEHITGYRFDELRGRNPSMLASGNTLVMSTTSYGRRCTRMATGRASCGTDAGTARYTPSGPIFPCCAMPMVKSPIIWACLPTSPSASTPKRASSTWPTTTNSPACLTATACRRLGQALASCIYANTRLAVLFIDLDRFKIINDTWATTSATNCWWKSPTACARWATPMTSSPAWAGTNLLWCWPATNPPAKPCPSPARCWPRWAPLSAGRQPTALHPSIGISVYPDDGDSVDALMKAADTAMYHAKAQGRTMCSFYRRNERRRRRAHGAGARPAPRHRPPATGCPLPAASASRQRPVCGVEALLRWPHPTRGQVSPLKFILIAEESGLIEALAPGCCARLASKCAHWKSIGIHGVRMAVNLSAHQLRSRQLVDTVREAMHAHGVQAGELELEITESAVMKDPQAAIDTLQQLRDLGVHLLSTTLHRLPSPAYLKLLPVDAENRPPLSKIETDR